MRSILSILLAAVGLAAPATAASQLLVAGPLESPLRLQLDGSGAFIEDAAARVHLPLPPGGDIDSFVATRNGWLAAGSVPVTGGRELVLWTGDAGKGVSLPPPPGRRSAVRDTPVVLVRDGELVGLAWLEGEAADRFGVWACTWDGRAWGAPAVVAAPSGGSQLALTGGVLADGTTLLAWSAFDGEDDEVLWSLRRGGHWTAPRAVTAGNHVPDVTPALRPDGDGALLVWSRYDGNDYRLRLARFAAGHWQPARWVGGAGTSAPRWQGPSLTFRDAAHGAWVAAAVDRADRLRVETAMAAPPEPRPAAWRRGDGALELLFPNR